MAIEVTAHGTGVVLPVQAQPRARRNGIVGEHAGALKVAVTQAPEKGKANDALVKVIADALKLKRSQIEVFSGDTSTRKMFLIADIAPDVLLSKIEASLPVESR